MIILVVFLRASDHKREWDVHRCCQWFPDRGPIVIALGQCPLSLEVSPSIRSFYEFAQLFVPASPKGPLGTEMGCPRLQKDSSWRFNVWVEREGAARISDSSKEDMMMHRVRDPQLHCEHFFWSSFPHRRRPFFSCPSMDTGCPSLEMAISSCVIVPPVALRLPNLALLVWRFEVNPWMKWGI